LLRYTKIIGFEVLTVVAMMSTILGIFIQSKSCEAKERAVSYIMTMTARVQSKKISGCESPGVWGQDELIGGKPPVLK
jgi:hypothetical protein